MKKYYFLGLAISAFVHLAAIPILSIYGVHICPVLNDYGFNFGCKFNGIFCLSVFSINTLLVSLGWKFLLRYHQKNPTRVEIFRYYPFLSLLIHFSAFVVGSHFLNAYLKNLEVPGPTLQRMNVAFLYTAILLGVLQSSMIDWLIQGWMRLKATPRPDPSIATVKQDILNMTARWTFSYFWDALPQLAVVIVTGTYAYAKFSDLAEDFKIDNNTILGLRTESLKILGLLAGWYALIRLFTFLKEKRLVDSIHQHLGALAKLNSQHYSATVASGFWENIFKGLNQTSGIIEQRSRLMKGLSSYVTGAVVDQVLSNQDLKAHGESRNLTILVSDLRNFTLMSNSMRAEDVVTVLNIYFSDMIEVLGIHGVTVDKFIGDGILAYVEGEGSQEKGVKAALAMHQKVAETNEKLKARQLPEVRLGVAIHWGSVILGNIGAQEKMQYTVIGDPVNATARLEGLCKQFDSGVIVSDIVLNSLSPDLKIQFTDLGVQEIRGLKNPLHVHGVKNETLLALAS